MSTEEIIFEEHMQAIRRNDGEFTRFKHKEMEFEKTYYIITYITNFIMRGRREISAKNLYQK